MVDLSKHLQRARQALERRQYDIAIEVCLECQEIDPANLRITACWWILPSVALVRVAKGLFVGLWWFLQGSAKGIVRCD